MPKPAMKDVIVLIPGITGSSLKRGDHMLWGFSPSVLAKALLTSTQFVEDLAPQPGDVADALLPDLTLLPGFWKIDGYGKVEQAIREDFDVEDGKNFFTFPYDWRLDNRLAARELAARCHGWLKQWRATANPNAKLIIVAHSMGGLVARYFLEVEEGWKDTAALISFGTPYLGSLMAVDALLLGLRKGPMGLIDLTRLARSLPSIYQLLPTYPCLDVNEADLKRFAEVVHPSYVDATLVDDARRFHQEIKDAVSQHLKDAGYRESRYRIHPVVGTEQKTFQFARIENATTTMLTERNGEDYGGDGTVPRVSATPLECRGENREMFSVARHGSLQNDDPVLTQLKGVITGFSLPWEKYQSLVEGGSVSLAIDDIYWDHEPVVVRTEPAGVVGELYATVVDPSTSDEVGRQQLLQDAEGYWSASFGLLPAGSYRLTITGGAIKPVRDCFVVAST